MKSHLSLSENENMLIGTIQLHFVFPSRSLKEKRRIINSIKDKTKNKFNVSIAEIDFNDDHNNALIGIAMVSNDGKHLNSVLYSIIDFLEKEFPGMLTDHHIEIL
ncbi:MAG: DUF503 domain-containing protein [Brevinematia bacterium]